MDILTNETITLMIIYLLPGFIINSIFSSAFPVEKGDSNTIILRYLLFGTLNYFTVILIDSISMGHYLIENLILIDLLRMIIMPTFIGGSLIFLSRFRTFEWLLNLIGLSRISSIPTSWDYIFHKKSNEGGVYVTIILKDYSKVFGFFDENSFASSLRPNYSNDIYLDKVYSDCHFSEELKSGIMLSQNDILAISFHKTTHNEEKETIQND